jgi:hypothetical protein
VIRVLRWLIWGVWALPERACIECGKGQRSPMCWDGRCRKCCDSYSSCGCEKKKITKEEAKMLSEYRDATGR